MHEKLKKLKDVFAGNGSLLIVMQDNPDPDSIASAVALRKLANSLNNIACSIAHGGTVGRGENRALVKYLDLNLHLCGEVDFYSYDLIGIVDTQPGTGNNSLPDKIIPDIVIDHHPMKELTKSAQFYDIRSRCGATCTMMLEYLLQAKVEIDMPLATGLLYGIRSDTQDLGREATNADIKAIEVLYPVANKRMLSEIQRGSVHREYFRMLVEALGNAYVYGDCAITCLRTANNPDMIAEIADLLLRDENIDAAVCYGIYKDKILFSVRTLESLNNADKIALSIADNIGTGGGHQTYAGGQISLENGSEAESKKAEEIIKRKTLDALGISEDREKLV